MSDPNTAAYAKAMDKKIFDDINQGATVAAIANPLGALGAVASILGPATSLASGVVDGSVAKAGTKEIMQFAAGKYLENVFGVTASAATRIISLVDMGGGWQAFVDRASNYFATKDTGNKK